MKKLLKSSSDSPESIDAIEESESNNPLTLYYQSSLKIDTKHVPESDTYSDKEYESGE